MSSVGAAPRAAVPVSNARAEASRRNGAKSRGPKTPEGKARASQNALKHGMRAQKYLVLPEEDAAEFHALEAALVAELAPVGVLQVVLARRVAVAAWRLARADRIEAELFEECRWEDGGLGLAMIRDGNGTRSFETLLRYRGAAMAEFWRALKTLKALQAEQAVRLEQPADTTRALEGDATRSAVPAQGALIDGSSQPAPQPNDSKPKGNRERVLAYAPPNEPEPRGTLHETAARWCSSELAAKGDPNKPESRGMTREIAWHAALHDPERRAATSRPAD